MPDPPTCPQCGAKLPEGWPEGQCAVCLLGVGLDSSPSGDDETDRPTMTAAAGASTATDRIGPYRLRQKVGEGGMGEVWLAEQTAPVRRRVALKLIKWGMDTKRVIARFEAEAKP